MSEYGNFIKCPACGFEDQDSWEMSETGPMDCTNCDIELYVEIHVDVTYTTTLNKKEDEK